MSNGGITPIPSSYTLDDTLRKLGLGVRQGFYQARLHEHIQRYLVGQRTFVYDADDVDEWAVRMARRRILVAWGVLSEKSPLADAPVKDGLDTTCPICGAFALRHPQAGARIRCEAGHETSRRRKPRRNLSR